MQPSLQSAGYAVLIGKSVLGVGIIVNYWHRLLLAGLARRMTIIDWIELNRPVDGHRAMLAGLVESFAGHQMRLKRLCRAGYSIT